MGKRKFLLVTTLFLITFSFSAAAKEFTAEGTVNAIKLSSQKLTISHGPIKGLMGAMKMDFKVADPAMLSDVGIGSKIKFTLTEDNKNTLTITDMEVTENASEKNMGN
ncbi:MAG: copper-binding protein [Gammaproteobacteria bacterium]|nr:copper-binding protein [Gammaproteobacteria bacterium]